MSTLMQIRYGEVNPDTLSRRDFIDFTFPAWRWDLGNGIIYSTAIRKKETPIASGTFVQYFGRKVDTIKVSIRYVPSLRPEADRSEYWKDILNKIRNDVEGGRVQLLLGNPNKEDPEEAILELFTFKYVDLRNSPNVRSPRPGIGGTYPFHVDCDFTFIVATFPDQLEYIIDNPGAGATGTTGETPIVPAVGI